MTPTFKPENLDGLVPVAPLGTGVARTAAPEQTDVEEPKPAETPALPADEWQDTPSLSGQAVLRPETVRRGPRQFRCFMLPAQEDQLNLLMQGTCPEDAPAILIRDQQSAECADGWKVLVVFQQLHYRKLAPSTKPPVR